MDREERNKYFQGITKRDMIKSILDVFGILAPLYIGTGFAFYLPHATSTHNIFLQFIGPIFIAICTVGATYCFLSAEFHDWQEWRKWVKESS